MDAPLDLYHASREELIALVLRQREQIADLEQEGARLRAELATQRAEMLRLTERVGALLATLEPSDDDERTPRADDDAGAETGRERPCAGTAPRPQTPGARVWPTADAADGAPGACLCSVSALSDRLVRRHGQTHARGDRGGPGAGWR